MTQSLHVKPITDQSLWSSFIVTTAPHSFLHSWQWGECARLSGHEPLRYGVYDGDRLVAVCLALDTRARRGRFLLCPHGPVFLDPTLTNEVLSALTKTLVDEARTRGCHWIRISPLLPNTKEYADVFAKQGFRPAPVHMVHPELSWVLPLAPTEEQLLAGMRKSTRYSIKKAEKDGVTIRMSTNPADLDTFWKVYEATVSRQQFTPFSRDYLAAEFALFSAAGMAAFFFAEYKGSVTGAALIIFDNHSGYYHHGATTQAYPGLTDAQLLQWHSICEAKRRGCTMYNFWGVVPETSTKHPWYGLSVFKRGFGGHEEAYLHAQDLPLSPRYWFTYIIETIRRIRRGL